MSPDLIQEMLTTRRSDAARFEGALDSLRTKGYMADGFDACCSNCGWKAALNHPSHTAGVLFSNMQNADEAFELNRFEVEVTEGVWIDPEDYPGDQDDLDGHPVRVERSDTLTGPVYFQWGCPKPLEAAFLADVRAAFEAADFQVVVPATRKQAFEVHPRGAA